MGKLTKNVIPAKPFADWLNQRFTELERAGVDPAAALCREVGWTDGQSANRRLWRFRHMRSETYVGRTDQNNKRYGRTGGSPGKRTVVPAEVFPREVVEEALHRAGVRLGEVYPYEALVDEMQMEYGVPRDQATRLADAWIERVWQTVWERAGLYVFPGERPKGYCRDCHKTTRVFMGVCEECCAPVESVLVKAMAA